MLDYLDNISTDPPPEYCLEDEVADGQWLDCSEEPEGTVFTVEPCSNEYCTCTTGYEYPIKNVSLT